jgi:hypothetical protein
MQPRLAPFLSRLFHLSDQAASLKYFSDFGINFWREDEQGLEFPVSALDGSLNTYLRCASPQILFCVLSGLQRAFKIGF